MKKKSTIIIIAIIVIVLVIAGVNVFSGEKTKDMRNDAISYIESSVELNDYRSKEQKEIENIISDTKEKINVLDDQDEINKLKESAINKISEIKTDKEITLEEEKARKEKARKEKAKKEKAEREQAELEQSQPVYNEAPAPVAPAPVAPAPVAPEEPEEPESPDAGGANSEGCVGNDAENFY